MKDGEGGVLHRGVAIVNVAVSIVVNHIVLGHFFQKHGIVLIE